jgi:MoxR-like ATPase
MAKSKPSDWKVYQGDGKARKNVDFPTAPPWRKFGGGAEDLKGKNFQPPPEAIEMVNAALSLRRPLLITGNPGMGKSSLAYAVARELGLGSVLKWSITTRSILKDGLYNYDAIGRLQDAQTSEKDNRQETGNYITLGALGTAFLPTERPRVLLIDEIDKSDIDLPNDLLNILEDGEFPIPELQRLETSPLTVRTIERDDTNKQIKADVHNGIVTCDAFPLVIMTSNGERDFPPPFLRRCLRLRMPPPGASELQRIVESHLGEEIARASEPIVEEFSRRMKAKNMLATDQLLNVIHIRSLENTKSEVVTPDKVNNDASLTLPRVQERLLKDLSSPEDI